MYSVGPSQNYAKQLPVIFWAAVKSIFRMRLTSYNIQMATDAMASVGCPPPPPTKIRATPVAQQADY